jgi:hypothetical protein
MANRSTNLEHKCRSTYSSGNHKGEKGYKFLGDTKGRQAEEKTKMSAYPNMGGLQRCWNNWDFCQQSLVVKFNSFCATQLGNSPQDITVIEVEQVSCEIELEHPLPQNLLKGYQGKSEDNISEIQKLGSSPHVLDLDLVSMPLTTCMDDLFLDLDQGW